MNELTKNFWINAGVKPGMHVLDFGCGQGVTTEMLAEIVGNTGSVTGIDINARSLAVAKEKATSNKRTNITYILGDIFEYGENNQRFDIIVGRRVLMYLTDPKLVIGELKKRLKNKGKILFQEHDSSSLVNENPMPLHNKVNGWLWKTVEKEGGNIHIGRELWDIFSHDGLEINDVKAEVMVQTPNKSIPLDPIQKSISSRIIAHKVATMEELDLANLAERLNTERIETNGIFVRETIFFIEATKID